MMRRAVGIATTLPFLLPTNFSCAWAGWRILPTLPSLPPPSLFWSKSCVPSCRRSTGQKYDDLSPWFWQLVSAAGQLLVAREGVVVLVADVVVQVVRAVG